MREKMRKKEVKEILVNRLGALELDIFQKTSMEYLARRASTVAGTSQSNNPVKFPSPFDWNIWRAEPRSSHVPVKSLSQISPCHYLYLIDPTKRISPTVPISH